MKEEPKKEMEGQMELRDSKELERLVGEYDKSILIELNAEERKQINGNERWKDQRKKIKAILHR